MTTNPMTSEEEKNLIDEVCDGLIERLGLEPDGHKTWAKTTDEIVKEVREEIEGKVDALLHSQKERVVEMCEEMKYKYRHTHDIQTVDGKYQCLLCGTPLKEMAPMLTQNEKRYCPHPKSYNKALSDLKNKIEEEI